MKPSVKTNAMRKALRYAASSLEEESQLDGVTLMSGRSISFSDADQEALRFIAAELRERASGHRGKKVK